MLCWPAGRGLGGRGGVLAGGGGGAKGGVVFGLVGVAVFVAGEGMGAGGVGVGARGGGGAPVPVAVGGGGVEGREPGVRVRGMVGMVAVVGVSLRMRWLWVSAR